MLILLCREIQLRLRFNNSQNVKKIHIQIHVDIFVRLDFVPYTLHVFSIVGIIMTCTHKSLDFLLFLLSVYFFSIEPYYRDFPSI